MPSASSSSSVGALTVVTTTLIIIGSSSTWSSHHPPPLLVSSSGVVLLTYICVAGATFLILAFIGTLAAQFHYIANLVAYIILKSTYKVGCRSRGQAWPC